MTATQPLRQNEPLTESAQAEQAVIDLKRVGKSRDPEKIEAVLKTATEINESILGKLDKTPGLADKQRLLSLSQKVTKEISACKTFKNTLIDHKEKIWKGNWITQFLFMAMHILPKNKAVIACIESTEEELKKDKPGTDTLQSNLKELQQFKEDKKLSGVMLDFTNLMISQIEAHIKFSEEKNPYSNTPKFLLVEKLLTPKTEQAANLFETPTYEEARDEIFLDEAKGILTLNNQSVHEQTYDQIVDNLAIVVYSKQDEAVDFWLKQLLDEPDKLDHVIRIIHTDGKCPQLKAALEQKSSWQDALHFDHLVTKKVDSKVATQLIEIGKLDAQQPLPTYAWKTLRELPLEQQKLIFERFPKIKEKVVKELSEIQRQINATEIKTPSDEEKVILVLPLFEGAKGIRQDEIKQQLVASLSKAYATVEKGDAINNHPLLVQLMEENPTFKKFIIDKFADALVEPKAEEAIQLVTAPSLLQEEVHMKALEKMADRIISPYYRNLTSLPADFDEARAQIVEIKEKLPDQKKLDQFLAKMDAVKQSFAKAPELGERLKSITTYAELEKFDRELATKSSVQFPQKEISDLRGKITKQKAALTDLGLIGKTTFSPITRKGTFDNKKAFADLSSRYEKLNSQPHSKELFLEYMKLEQEWNSYFGDKSITTTSRDQAHAALMTIALKLVYQGTQPAPLDVTPYLTNLLNGPFAFPGLELTKMKFMQNQLIQEQLSQLPETR